MTTEISERSVLLVGPRPASGSLPADLQADRFTVLLAADPEEVRGALRNSCPSAVIVDLDMPGAGGLDAVGMIRDGGPEASFFSKNNGGGLGGPPAERRRARPGGRGAALHGTEGAVGAAPIHLLVAALRWYFLRKNN